MDRGAEPERGRAAGLAGKRRSVDGDPMHGQGDAVWREALDCFLAAGLPTRAARALANVGVVNPGDLRARDWAGLRTRLLRARDCGPVTVESIRAYACRPPWSQAG